MCRRQLHQRRPYLSAQIKPTTIHCGWTLRGAICIGLGCALSLLAMNGCQKVLFPENEPRNQFERSDNLRDRFTPVTEPDVFGNPRPALRARLSPPTD